MELDLFAYSTLFVLTYHNLLDRHDTGLVTCIADAIRKCTVQYCVSPRPTKVLTKISKLVMHKPYSKSLW